MTASVRRTAASIALAALLLVSCGGSDDAGGGAPADTGSSSSADDESTADVGSTADGGSVEPTGGEDEPGAGGVASLDVGDISYTVEGLRCDVEETDFLTGIRVVAISPDPVTFNYSFQFLDGYRSEKLTMSGPDGTALIEHRQDDGGEVVNTQTQSPGNFLNSPFVEIDSIDDLTFDIEANTLVTVAAVGGAIEELPGLLSIDCP